MTTCIAVSVRCTHLARQTHDGAEVSSVCLLCTHGTRRALGQHDVWPRRVWQHVPDSTAKTHSIRHALSGAFIRTNDRSSRPYAVYSICTCVIRVTFCIQRPHFPKDRFDCYYRFYNVDRFYES